MILTCSECQSQFHLDPALLDKDGRKVRCSSCKYEWFQEPEVETDFEENIEEDIDIGFEDDLPNEDIEEDIEVDLSDGELLDDDGDDDDVPNVVLPEDTGIAVAPAQRERQPSKAGRVSAVVLFAAICIGLFVFKDTMTNMWPDTHVVYNTFGATAQTLNKNDISFERFEAIRSDQDLTISGQIYNLRNEDVILPPLKISIQNKNYETIERAIITLDNNLIQKEGTLKIEEVMAINTQDDIQFVKIEPQTFLD